MYASAADALLGVLKGQRGSRISSMSKMARLTNGIKYFAVEVTGEDGAQYGISAYDNEAEELYEVAVKGRAQTLEMPMVVSTP